MNATCQHIQEQGQPHTAAVGGSFGHTKMSLHMPSSIALAS